VLVLALLFERERGLVAVMDEEAGLVVDCLAMREVAAVVLEMPRVGAYTMRIGGCMTHDAWYMRFSVLVYFAIYILVHYFHIRFFFFCPFFHSFQIVLLVRRLAMAMVFIRDLYGWAGLLLCFMMFFVSMVMVMFFKRCFQTSSSHSCRYFQHFVSFRSVQIGLMDYG
jgi:hypothetical protein